MKKILVALCLGALLNLYALTWNTPAAIPPGTSGTITGNGYFGVAFDSNSEQLMVAWNSFGNIPYYSIYNGTSWSTAAAVSLGPSSGAFDNVALVWDSSSLQTIMTWGDKSSQIPYYATYNGSSWSTPAAMPLGASGTVADVPNLVFDSGSNQVIAAWANPFTAYYTVYNGSSWSTPSIIPAGLSNGANGRVFLTYDSSSNQVIALWADHSTFVPYYSIYNGTSWSTAAAISLGASSGVALGALAVDTNPDETILVWLDETTSELYYSIYSKGSWSTGAAFPAGENIAEYNVALAFDAAADQMVALWTVSSGHAVYYSTFDGSAWTTPAALSLEGSGSAGGLSTGLVYNPASQQLFGIWRDSSINLPFFATTQAPGPNPPGSATAQLLFDNYINATDRVHLLQWTASSDATTVGYQISSGAGVEGSTTATQIYLRNRVKGQSYTYSIAAYNESGITGTPLVVSAEG